MKWKSWLDLEKGKKTFEKGYFSLLQVPSLFSHVRRSLGEGEKPFIGIYLFAMQKDKCLSSFCKTFLNICFKSMLTYPYWEQSQKFTKIEKKPIFIHQFS
jgi:hypothetical protein